MILSKGMTVFDAKCVVVDELKSQGFLSADFDGSVLFSFARCISEQKLEQFAEYCRVMQ